MTNPQDEVRYPCCEHCTGAHRTDAHVIPCVRCGLGSANEQVRSEQNVEAWEDSLTMRVPESAAAVTVPLHTKEQPAGRHHVAQLAPEGEEQDSTGRIPLPVEYYNEELRQSTLRDQARINDARDQADAEPYLPPLAEGALHEYVHMEDAPGPFSVDVERHGTSQVTEIHGIPVTAALTPEQVREAQEQAESRRNYGETHLERIELHLKMAAVKATALRIAAKHGTEDAYIKCSDEFHDIMDQLKRMT